jgi:hypothetical protein
MFVSFCSVHSFFCGVEVLCGEVQSRWSVVAKSITCRSGCYGPPYMVASAEGDVASTCIHYSQLGRVTIFIAKNETSIADEIQMQRLLGLCSGDVSRYKDFKDFALKGLGFIATFCQGKLRKRMKAVQPDMLRKVATKIEANIPSNFNGPWDENLKSGKPVEACTVLKGLGCRLKAKSGDIDVLAWAQARECSLSAIIPMQLRYVASKLESLDELTRDEPGLLRLLLICDKLFRSDILQKLLEATKLQLEAKGKFETDLGKLGAYYHGLELLYGALIEPCQQGAAPLKISCRLLLSPTKSRVKLAGANWYELLRGFWRDSSRGELKISQQYLAEEWGKENRGISGDQTKDTSTPIEVPDEVPINLHCKLRLLEHLENLGIRKAFIGVSKGCCELCSVAIAHLNFLGSKWYASCGHERMYVGRLPENAAVRQHMKCAVDDMLRDELETKLALTESPPMRPHQREVDDFEPLKAPMLPLDFD